MANIDIKLSQNALAHQPANGLGVIVDGIERIVYAAAAEYQAFSSAQLSGSTLVYTYPDGAVETYSGFVKDQAGASSGTATAAAYELELKDAIKLSYSGTLNLDYTTIAAGLEVDRSVKGMQITDIGYALELPSTDPQYNVTDGNLSMRMKGAVNVAPNGSVNGTISQFSISGEKNLTAVTIDGNFQVSGNLLTDGQALTHSVVNGTLTGYHQAYLDGSHVDVGGVSAVLPAPATVDTTLLANAAYFGGNDTISIDLPALLPAELRMASGAGDDQLTLKGGGGLLNADGGSGNDRIALLDDNHQVDGGQGRDTVVLLGARADYQTSYDQAKDTLTVVNKATGLKDILSGVERVQFRDASVGLDLEGNGGQAYRLYQAAFDRTPDKAGLGYWIGVLDQGLNLRSAAQSFVNSQEFKDAYGANPTNHDLVMRFYENILHRAPDQAGFDYWFGLLDSKQVTVADVLMGMSESAENKAGLIGVMGGGFEFTPYHA